MDQVANRVTARIKEKLIWWLLCGRAPGAGFDPRSLRRVRDYLRNSLKLQLPRHADPRQRPEHYFPGLTARPWYDAEEFGWTRRLRGAHEIITGELRGIQARLRRQPERLTEQGPWDVYYLYHMGRKVDGNCRRCPATAQVIESLPGFRGTGHAYFSVLSPRAHIKPHCGPINAWLRCHLGLVVPEKCRIRVGDETRSWSEKSCLVFDDAFEHEAWNPSEAERTVLVLDFWHPELTAAEAWAMRQIIRLSAAARRLDAAAADAAAAKNGA